MYRTLILILKTLKTTHTKIKSNIFLKPEIKFVDRQLFFVYLYYSHYGVFTSPNRNVNEDINS